MKNKILLLLLLGAALFVITPSRAQTTSGSVIEDYASYPYWMNMMQDPTVNFFETQKAFYAYWKDREVTRGTGYKPFKRWEYYWQSRINPDGTFPSPDHVYQAFTGYAASHPVTGSLKTGQPQWTELGPKTRQDYGGYVGVGRINAIGFHPTDTATVFIGAPAGGFWITHDGGRTWSSGTDNLPTLGVSAILTDAANVDNILIGTGDRDGGNSAGMGVFKSTDGGLSFTPFNTGMGNVTVGMLARDENLPNHILAACNGGIFMTDNGGQSWTKTSPDNSNFRDVKFRPGSSAVAYASSNNGFYRSENGGESWTLLPTSAGYPGGGRLVIGVTPGNDSLVYLVGGASAYQGCFLSRNFGQTFVTQSTSPNILGYAYEGNDDKSQAWYDLMIHVDPQIPNLVHVGGINMWKSSDGGKTWAITAHWWGDRTNEVHADQHTFAYNPLNNRIYAGNDGGIYWTGNQGGTWTEISKGLGIGQLYRIGVSATVRDKVTAGFQDNGSATYIGTTWLNSGGGDGMECAVDPWDARWSYTTLYYGPITRYYNNSSGRKVAGINTNGITEEGAWVTPFLISEWDGNVMVIGYKNIWISKNIRNSSEPITFTKISNNLANRNDVNMSALEQSPANSGLLFAIRSDGKLFRTENLMDASVQWTDLSSKLPVTGTANDIECHPYDANIVYIATNRKIYKSVNKGSSWENISGTLPNININGIACDKTSNDGLYIGTDAGVYYLDSEMTDWILYGEKLPVSVEVTEVEIYCDRINRDDSRLRAATYGRGLWEIPLAPANAILPPSLLIATDADNVIELEWVAPFYQQNITGYRVFRNGDLIGTINGTSYTDMQVQPDITYTYQVAALYAGNIQSGFTNEASATIVAPILLPYQQGFDQGTAGWKAKMSYEGWKHGNSEQLLIPGREGKFFGASCPAAGSGVNISDYLITPSIDLSSFTGKTITLKFAYTMRLYRTYDKFSIHFRAAPDSAWVKLQDMKAPSKTAWVWDTTEINLPERALTPAMQIGYYYSNSNEFAWGAAIDDVTLYVNTTSAQLLDNISVINVYPNPGSGLFHLDMNLAKPGDVTIRVLTLTGQEVMLRKIENASGLLEESIDLSTQPKGMYYILLRSAAGEWKQKITVQ
ncbi:MAG TPA: hypothetical protein DC042_01190 [Bacteroidales bacterium]|nr:hypothetical protein [Bacteroidales bacterium]